MPRPAPQRSARRCGARAIGGWLRGAPSWLLIGAYDRRRPGAKRAATGLGPIVLAATAATLAATHSANPTADRALFVAFRALEVLYLAALAAWGGFFAGNPKGFVRRESRGGLTGIGPRRRSHLELDRLIATAV